MQTLQVEEDPTSYSVNSYSRYRDTVLISS